MGIARFAVVLGLALAARPAAAADMLAVSLASTRTQFFADEPIELAVLYVNEGGNLAEAPLSVRHADGSGLDLAVPLGAGRKSQSQIVTLKVGALKPGRYPARVGDAGEGAAFAVHSPLHASAYFVGDWVHHGRTAGTPEAKGGWMYMTSDYVSMPPRAPKSGDLAESYVAAGMRPFALMVLGGGHQLDLDAVNDWGDPWVQRACIWRLNLAALSDRIYPIAGLHCYDEPGLTWWKGSPYAIPHQVAEFKRLTGKDIPRQPAKGFEMLADWIAFLDMRMKYLEQCWNGTVWGTRTVAPSFETVNQVSDSYAPGDITDGVDCRQNRPYTIVSGHGGYSDQAYGTMQPVRGLEAMRGFGWDVPHYYLPMWYPHNWQTIRNAVWMSWVNKVEGMLYTPDLDFELNGDMDVSSSSENRAIFEIAEINRRMAKVGDVMRQLPKTLSPVAVLHSHRQFAYDVAAVAAGKLQGAGGSPDYDSPHREWVTQCYFAAMDTGIVPNWIEEAEVELKGAKFLSPWRVILCPGLLTATPALTKALTDYVAGGGRLIQFRADKLRIPGATVIDHTADTWNRYWKELLEGQAPSNKGTDLTVRKWTDGLIPEIAANLLAWAGERPCGSSNKDVFVVPHKAGRATYLLIANNAQDESNPRGVKHELVPAETEVTVPRGGVVYDLFDGGKVAVADGKAALRLPAGDGACWLHLPAEPGPIAVRAAAEGNDLRITVTWGTEGYLPFRLRVLDPAGNEALNLFRATTPGEGGNRFVLTYALGANAAPGQWSVEASEWLTGGKAAAKVEHRPAGGALAQAHQDSVLAYFDDARRIVDLLAGKPLLPNYATLNWDFPRVWGVEAKKFALFGPAEAAGKIAAALKAKGMAVEVNPDYKIVPFEREPDRGGAGPTFRTDNFENIYAHTIVLPGHKLLEVSAKRGHINRPQTDAFPGPGRACVQWGLSCYQAGWQNVFVQGDLEAGTTWLLEAIQGKAPAAAGDLKVQVRAAAAKPTSVPDLAVARSVRVYDTPVGALASADGAATFVLLYDGSARALDKDGRDLWTARPLLLGSALALSPKGDRLAVAGYPGLAVLNAKDGKVLGEQKAKPIEGALPIWTANEMVSVAWNSAGTLVAGAWRNTFKGDQKAPRKPLPLALLDADGKARPRCAGEHLRDSFRAGHRRASGRRGQTDGRRCEGRQGPVDQRRQGRPGLRLQRRRQDRRRRRPRLQRRPLLHTDRQSGRTGRQGPRHGRRRGAPARRRPGRGGLGTHQPPAGDPGRRQGGAHPVPVGLRVPGRAVLAGTEGPRGSRAGRAHLAAGRGWHAQGDARRRGRHDGLPHGPSGRQRRRGSHEPRRAGALGQVAGRHE
jgi:hypothetical protein